MCRCAFLLVFFCLIVAATARPATARPQVAGLQVALRAHGLYLASIDGIYGPASARGLRRFQRKAGLDVDGRIGPVTRHALGPLGRPGFGRRTLQQGALGWDVSVMQFLLARRGSTWRNLLRPSEYWTVQAQECGTACRPRTRGASCRENTRRGPPKRKDSP